MTTLRRRNEHKSVDNVVTLFEYTLPHGLVSRQDCRESGSILPYHQQHCFWRSGGPLLSVCIQMIIWVSYLFRSELLWSGQVLAIIVSKMVVAHNRSGL